MVADSITDSELFHGSPISRDFAKKRKANWFWKLKQWKIDARRRQWICQLKRSYAGEEENGFRLKSLRDKLTDRKTASDRFSYVQALRIDHEEGSYKFTICDDDEDDLGRALSASSPTSVLKNKDSDSNKSGDGCFCCSKQITDDEEETFDDACDNWDGFRDASNSFDRESPLHDEATDLQQEEEKDPNPSTSQRKKSSPAKLFDHKDKCKQEPSPEKKNRSDQKKDSDEKSECPICSGVMDSTDLDFFPCSCGFQLCLFCHNKINVDDGRCPICREKYIQTSNNSGQVSFQRRGGGTVPLSTSFKGLDIA